MRRELSGIQETPWIPVQALCQVPERRIQVTREGRLGVAPSPLNDLQERTDSAAEGLD